MHLQQNWLPRVERHTGTGRRLTKQANSKQRNGSREARRDLGAHRRAREQLVRD